MLLVVFVCLFTPTVARLENKNKKKNKAMFKISSFWQTFFHIHRPSGERVVFTGSG